MKVVESVPRNAVGKINKKQLVVQIWGEPLEGEWRMGLYKCRMVVYRYLYVDSERALLRSSMLEVLLIGRGRRLLQIPQAVTYNGSRQVEETTS
jgi:hypothetical protein